MFGRIKESNISKRSWCVTMLVGLVLALGAFAPVSTWAGSTSQAATDLDHLKMLSGQDFEIDFMSMMMQHHQSALDMAKLAPDRASHQEVKDAAQKIIADQTREISDMTAWLRQWYTTSPKQGMMHDMQGMGMSDMMKLEGLKGEEFDKQFLTMMRMHHTGAVEMAQLVPGRATHAELKTLGQNIVSSQTVEIRQFESWLKTWYNINAAGAVSMPPDKLPGKSIAGGNSSNLPATGSGTGDAGFLLMLASITLLSSIIMAVGVWMRKQVKQT